MTWIEIRIQQQGGARGEAVEKCSCAGADCKDAMLICSVNATPTCAGGVDVVNPLASAMYIWQMGQVEGSW